MKTGEQKQQSAEAQATERRQLEQAWAIMDAVDAKVSWERVDNGVVFTMYLTPTGGQYLVAHTIGSERPWIEVYGAVDDGNRWDTLGAKIAEQEVDRRAAQRADIDLTPQQERAQMGA